MRRFSMDFLVAAGWLLGAGWLLTGCGRSEATSIGAVVPASLESDPAELRVLKTIRDEPVEGLLGHRGRPFSVEARVPSLGQYPCSTCHLEPLVIDPGLAALPAMHVDIELHHASAEVMACDTCHNPEALDYLQSGQRRDIAFNHAYTLCAQCHFEQVEDWAGGAHGKRLGGWMGRRVVQNCTACHDPHAPAIAPRWPVAFPAVPPPGGAGHE